MVRFVSECQSIEDNRQPKAKAKNALDETVRKVMSKVLRMLLVEVGLVERAVVVLAHLSETFSLALA